MVTGDVCLFGRCDMETPRGPVPEQRSESRSSAHDLACATGPRPAAA